MAETDYAALAEQAREAAALRTRRGVIPPPRLGVTIGGRQEGELPAALANFLIPQTPLDVAMYALGGPFGRAAKIGMLGAGAYFTDVPEAQAGPSRVAQKALSEINAMRKAA